MAKDVFECGLNIKFYTYLSTLIFSLARACLCLFGCRHICIMHVYKCVCTLETEFSLGVVAVNTDQNQPGRWDRDYLAYRLQSIVKERLGRNSFRHLEAGTEAKTTKKYCLLTLSPWLLGLLPYTTQDLLPRGDTVYSGPSPPTLSAIKKISLMTCPQANIMELLSWDSLFQDVFSFLSNIIKTNHYRCCFSGVIYHVSWDRVSHLDGRNTK